MSGDTDSFQTYQPVGPVFVHTKGGGEGTAAGDGDSRQFQQPLQGTVLPIASVKYRECNVYGDIVDAALFQQKEPVVSAVGGEHCRGAVRGITPAVIEQLVHRSGIMVPGAFRGDTDENGIVFLRFRMTPDAEDNDTLYSGEQPPKKTATFHFFIINKIPFLHFFSPFYPTTKGTKSKEQEGKFFLKKSLYLRDFL